MSTTKGGACCDEDIPCCPLNGNICGDVGGCITTSDNCPNSCEEKGGETLFYVDGVCCNIPQSCCSTDPGCAEKAAKECEITGGNCGVFCPDGAQTNSMCCSAIKVDGDDALGNHFWVGDPYGDGYCCTSASYSATCCSAAGRNWCNDTCCADNFTCVNGSCCHVDNACGNQCCNVYTQTCVNGSCCSTPNADATECCAYGVGNDGTCCATDPSTCSNGTTTDTNGCTICKEELKCSSSADCKRNQNDSAYCTEDNTCIYTCTDFCAYYISKYADIEYYLDYKCHNTPLQGASNCGGTLHYCQLEVYEIDPPYTTEPVWGRVINEAYLCS